MGKLIETGIFTSSWVIGTKRVGKDGFVALVSSDQMGTNPVVVVRRGLEGLTQLPTDPQKQLGCWTQLSKAAYKLAEKAPVTIYGGEGSFNLTPYHILTADTRDARDIDRAFGRMMNRALRFTRAIMEAA